MSVNVLLVDDEAVDLEWLRRRVLASGLDIHVAGTANSGFLALKVMEEQRIDLILSDIRMPIMSGTQFARKAKVINPEVKVVFISGHEDFNYAREAIEINACDYLLKPVEDKELYDLLSKLCKEVEEEKEQARSFSETLSLVSEELLLRWLEHDDPGFPEPHLQSILHPLLSSGCAAAFIEIDDLEWKLRDLSEDARRVETRTIIQRIKSLAMGTELGALAIARQTRLIVLSALPEDLFVKRLNELIHEVAQTTSYTVTVGVGKYTNDAQGLHESFQQAQASLSAKWLLGKNRLLRDPTEPARQGAPGTPIDGTISAMLNAIMDYDLVVIDDCLLDLLYKDMPLASKKDVYELIIRITSSLHAELLQRSENLYELLEWESHQPDVLFQFETVHDVVSWLRRRFFELSEKLYVKRQRQKRKLIDEIMGYVEEHLEKKITLKEVAAQFDFTPNYLGHLFKEETGMLFSEYLNECKMNRVCQLLRDPTLKVYEVAELMGYKNIIYFNRQFKASMGMTPGEYRKKNKI
ncbi:response regulator [Paenibacillus woosongensis]|uniref:Response regulator n=1 Tax=Paenibacillus woosongensis TaxID=307580 RepID=A0A7X2Z1X3_9BACL|nr:response regulator [Paenibacillus woosongensis]MUG45356.1 response regulator [Paenibacillus woosongensis]